VLFAKYLIVEHLALARVGFHYENSEGLENLAYDRNWSCNNSPVFSVNCMIVGPPGIVIFWTIDSLNSEE
jgi:hypothetical protein